MPNDFRNSTGMLLFQMAISTALIMLFGWLHFGPRHVELGSWEQMLYFGFFPAFVIYDCLRLKRRLGGKR